jgi:hypothetical protein
LTEKKGFSPLANLQSRGAVEKRVSSHIILSERAKLFPSHLLLDMYSLPVQASFSAHNISLHFLPKKKVKKYLSLTIEFHKLNIRHASMKFLNFLLKKVNQV